jgi:hypothetical protein
MNVEGRPGTTHIRLALIFSVRYSSHSGSCLASETGFRRLFVVKSRMAEYTWYLFDLIIGRLKWHFRENKVLKTREKWGKGWRKQEWTRVLLTSRKTIQATSNLWQFSNRTLNSKHRNEIWKRSIYLYDPRIILLVLSFRADHFRCEIKSPLFYSNFSLSNLLIFWSPAIAFRKRQCQLPSYFKVSAGLPNRDEAAAHRALCNLFFR